MPLSPGARLGVYEVTARIGEGGMGQVYRARDSKLQRDVALKILPDAFAADPDRLARFTREARTLASLNHPNIAHIHGLEESDGVRALVIELVEGDDLSLRLARGAIPLDEALAIAKQIAEALEAAHEQGVIHRDLKPENIKVRADGTVKVLDFGLAKAMEPTDGGAANASQSPTNTAPAITQAGVVLGTAAYMSPEQARSLTVDKRTDIWAFGCVLYEMLTGRRAFAGPTFSDTVAAILEREPAWTALPVGVPQTIRRLLERTLEKDARRRLRDIGDARVEIEDAQHGAQQPKTIVPRTARTDWRFAIAGAVALIALVVAAMLWMLQRPPSVVRESRLEISTPPTMQPWDLAIAPDGLAVAFVAESDGKPMLWVRPLNGVAARPLAGTIGAMDPFWSPDNQSIGFFADGKLKRIDVKGGAAQTLAEARQPHGGTWSNDGSIIFVPHQLSPLLRISSGGGEPTPITRMAPGHVGHLFPQLLPDGAHVLYFVTGAPEIAGAYLGRLDGTAPRKLLDVGLPSVFLRTGHLLFVRDDALFAQAFDPDRSELSGSPVRVADDVAVGSSSGGPSKAAVSVSDAGDILYRRPATGSARLLTWFGRSGTPVRRWATPTARDERPLCPCLQMAVAWRWRGYSTGSPISGSISSEAAQ